MAWITENHPGTAIRSLVEQIIAAGQLSRQDHVRLTSTILADYQLSDEDRCQISRVLDYVQIGRLRLID